MPEQTLKKSLLASVATFLIGSSALAQDEAAGAAAERDDRAASEGEVEFETIVVTGTRLRNPNLLSASPVTSVTSEELRLTGRTRLEDALERIPALDQTSQIKRFSDGQTFLNLRNLGTARTLTVVNGKRFVPGQASSSIDVNSIPQALIERVEVLTGGASAIYGADAVTGVVNFILKDDYEGLAFSGQHGAAVEDWDSEETRFSVLAGTNFSGGRGNITASYGYSHTNSLLAADRDFASTGYRSLVSNPAGFGAVPAFVYAQETAGSRFGAVIDGFGFYTANGTNPDGTPHLSNLDQEFAFWEVPGADLRPETTTHAASFSVRYEVSDRFNPYADLYYSKNEARSLGYTFSTYFHPIEFDNPFVSQAAIDEFFALASPFDLFAFNRLENDRPIREDQESDSIQTVVGFEGELSEHFRYEMSANFGRNEIDRNVTQIAYDRYWAAADAVDDGSGNIVCRSNLDPSVVDFYWTPIASFTPGANSGCVPFNPFVRDEAVNGAALDWIYNMGVGKNTIEQRVVNAYIAGDLSRLGLTLPGGDIEYVLGAEYRKEEFTSRVNIFADEEVGIGDRALGINVTDPLTIEAKEMFGEIALPLFANEGILLNELTLQLAFRYSDYDPSGSNWTYNGGLVWAPSDQLRLRTSYARAVRSPALFELFEPQTLGNDFLEQDPCDVENRGNGSEFREANCVAVLTAAGADPTTYELDDATGGFALPDRLFGGNPDLEPEVGDTFSIGFVAEPDFIDGLSVTLDYYEIEVTDTIGAATSMFTLSQCVDLSSIDNQFCDKVVRDFTGAPILIETPSINIGTMKTSGVEGSLQYQWPETRAGQFRTDLNFHYLKKLTVQTDPTPESLTDERGINGTDFSFVRGSTPEWVANANVGWTYDRWNASLLLHYESETLRADGGNDVRAFAHDVQEAPFIGSSVNVSLGVGYQFSDTMRATFGVDNLFDSEPEFGEIYYPYDPRGRSIYLGFDMQLAPFSD